MNAADHFTVRASYCSKRATYGGSLEVSTAGLKFSPNVIDRMVGAKEIFISGNQVVAVDTKERTGNPLNGGLRDRLRVEIDETGEYVFLVNSLQEVIARIRTILQLIR